MVLNAQPKIVAFAGSLRSESANKKLVLEASKIASDLGADVNFINLKDYPVPLYNADLEAESGMPENAKFIRDQMLASQIILIATPEYNGSITALLKNTIDWASRDENGSPSRQAFQGKRFAIMSASPGPGGGSRSLVHLNSILEILKGEVIAEPISVADAYNAFDEHGSLKDPKLYNELHNLVKNALN